MQSRLPSQTYFLKARIPQPGLGRNLNGHYQAQVILLCLFYDTPNNLFKCCSTFWFSPAMKGGTGLIWFTTVWPSGPRTVPGTRQALNKFIVWLTPGWEQGKWWRKKGKIISIIAYKGVGWKLEVELQRPLSAVKGWWWHMCHPDWAWTSRESG